MNRSSGIVAVALLLALLLAGCSSRFVGSAGEETSGQPVPGPSQAVTGGPSVQQPGPAISGQQPVPGPSQANPGTGPGRQPGKAVSQSSSGGAVTIKVTWLTGRSDSIVFDVVMDTHSVDLDGFDLKELAVLRDSQGKEYRPTSWSAPPGSHHRSGQLAFARLSQTGAFELIIRDVAGVKERTFNWPQS